MAESYAEGTHLKADVISENLDSTIRQDLFEKCYRYTRAEEARKNGIYPYFLPIRGSEGTEVQIGDHTCIMIGSNNYLGLTHDPRVMDVAEKTARKYGTGCTGSRFLNGTLDLHEELENDLAKFIGKEACLVFSTGYQSNLGLLSTILQRRDIAIADKLVHASIVDGIRMSGAQLLRFAHNDISNLRSILESCDPSRGVLICVDGLYSMEGDLAPVSSLLDVAKEVNARLFVDESHAIGVIGPTGAGTCEKFRVSKDVDLIMGTFSKSFASIGGFIAAEARVIDYVKHHARSMIFSAAMPPYAVATVKEALRILGEEPWRRERLATLQERMNREFRGMGFNTGDSESPIIPIIIGDFDRTLMIWKELLLEGVFTNPVIPPAVPSDSCRLRTSYMATHTDAQMDKVLSVFHKVGKKFGVI